MAESLQLWPNKMSKLQAFNGKWVPCDSRNELMANFFKKSKIIEAEDPAVWGSMVFESGVAVPIGYANVGLKPIGVQLGNMAFIGVSEILIGYNCQKCTHEFKYKMPTIFHEFVRFDEREIIVRDEIGFVGISYAGNENWVFCIDQISSYDLDGSKIAGMTVEGEEFVFLIPS